MRRERMASRELGLVLGRQLLGVEDLHFGLWDADLELKPGNLAAAQQRYTDLLIGALPPPPARVLDVGCGTGHILTQLLDRGYRVDGVIPAPHLARVVHERLEHRPGCDTRLFECKFEDFPVAQMAGGYDVALFGESFQYIPMDASLPAVHALLKPGGVMVICDFFKTERHGDGGAGDRSFGGGHRLGEFHAKVRATPFRLLRDEDLTRRISPNLDLIDDVLLNKVKPVGETLGRYFRDNYPVASWIARKLLARKLGKANYKYFSGHRNKDTFERYKTYRLMVYASQPSPQVPET
jgi:SAM-dependent methyltransferase